MDYKGAIKYLAAVILTLSIGIILYKQGAFEQLRNISSQGYLLAVFLLFLAYSVSGFQLFYLLKQQGNTSLKLPDILLLPCSMNLFGYLIPTNGGMIFSVLFLKAKYRVDFVKTVSIGFGLVFIMLLLNGIIGLYFCFTTDLNILFLIASLLFLFSPFLAWILSKLLESMSLKSGSWLSKLKFFIEDALRQSLELLAQKKIFLFLVFTNLLVILLNVVLYYWMNLMLDTGLSFAVSSLTILMLNISSLVRIVPGNLGIEELVASAIFSLTGSDPMTGAVITLVFRAVNLSLTVPVGLFHTLINYKIIADPLQKLFHRKK